MNRFHSEAVNAVANRQPLPREEQLRLLVLAKAGDEDARQTLIVSNMRLVIKVAGKHPATHVELDDRVQAGAMGLMRAIELFDETKGVAFSTYAWYWIKNGMDRMAERDGLIRTPVLVESFNRFPVEESRCETITDSSCDPAEIAEREETKNRNKKLLRSRMDRLPSRLRDVVRRRLSGETMSDVAKDLGVSKERVRQLERRALKVLFRSETPPSMAAILYHGETHKWRKS